MYNKDQSSRFVACVYNEERRCHFRLRARGIRQRVLTGGEMRVLSKIISPLNQTVGEISSLTLQCLHSQHSFDLHLHLLSLSYFSIPIFNVPVIYLFTRKRTIQAPFLRLSAFSFRHSNQICPTHSPFNISPPSSNFAPLTLRLIPYISTSPLPFPNTELQYITSVLSLNC